MKLLHNIGIILLSTICLLIIIAFYTVTERKVMAAIQRRQGPHKVGILGLLQAFADALKLIAKEMLIPSKTGQIIFISAPLIILTLSFISWSVISYQSKAFVANILYAVIFILAISSLNVYCIIMAGWSSNSKYSFLGSLRSAAQMISYEVVISVIILLILFLSMSLNFGHIVKIQTITLFFIFCLPIFVIFLLAILAETNRSPFDLPEAEAELVAGYNLEYSSIIFAMFFLAEYANMILMSTIFVLFFLGYNHEICFNFENNLRIISNEIYLDLLKILIYLYFFNSTSLILIYTILNIILIIILCFFFILVRATLPRYRYDLLMEIGWKVLMPIACGCLILILFIQL